MSEERVQLRLESDGFSCDHLQVFELTGAEIVSRLPHMNLGVVVIGETGLEVSDVEGALASLVFTQDGEELRRFNGMIAQVDDLLDTEPDHHTYRLVLVPRAHRATLVKIQEIFMDLTVPEIIQKKLALVGLEGPDVTLRLTRSYPKREFVIQYKETDLDFISRLAEHEGISFHFEHEHGSDQMVFSDHSRGFATMPGRENVPFRSRGERRDVYAIESSNRVIPQHFGVHDYNYRTPLVDVTGNAQSKSGFMGGVVEYGSHAKTPAEAEMYAKLRAEESESTHRVFSLESDLGFITAGHRFTLEGHPKLGDQSLQVLEIHHAAQYSVGAHGGKDPRGYSNRFRAIDGALTFRPPRVTPRPRIDGMVTGTIAHEQEGTETLFARLDEQGRYLVRFKLDTSPAGERATVSRRIRMMQQHAGANYGTHMPLKPGVEVMVAFADGDPDRPLIIGCAPNPVTASPVDSNCAPVHRIKTATGIIFEMKDA